MIRCQAPGPRCPYCDHSSTVRLSRRRYERWLGFFNAKRPHKCKSCRRRFWAEPLGASTLTMPKSGGTVVSWTSQTSDDPIANDVG